MYNVLQHAEYREQFSGYSEPVVDVPQQQQQQQQQQEPQQPFKQLFEDILYAPQSQSQSSSSSSPLATI